MFLRLLRVAFICLVPRAIRDPKRRRIISKVLPGVVNRRASFANEISAAVSRWSVAAALLVTTLLCGTLIPTRVRASTWNNPAGGSWNIATNWNTIPNAVDAIADFSTLDLTSDATVTLDGNETVGTLLFGDVNPSNNWFLNAGTPSISTLTLSVSAPTGSPDIDVANPSAEPLPSANSLAIYPYFNETATINAVLAGAQGFSKTGAGTLTLTAQNTVSGTVNLNFGTLNLDYSAAGAPASNILSAGNALYMGTGLNAGTNGTLNIIGANGGANSQSFATTTVDFGAAAINVNQNSATSVNVSLGNLTRVNHGSLNLTLPTTGNISATSSSIPNVNGIIGAWATVGTGSTASWAANDGSGNIIALPFSSPAFTAVTGAPAIVSAPGSNVLWTGSTGNGTMAATGTTDINTLLYADNGSTARTLTIASGSTLRLGAVGSIFKSDISNATNILTIGATGSFLTAGGAANTAGELILDGNSITPDVNGLVVASSITNNGTGVVTLVKTGNAAVQLNAAGTYTGGTYIDSGRLRANTATSYGTGPVYVASGAGAYLATAGTYANNFFISGKGFFEGGSISNGAFGSGAIRLAANGVIVSGTVTLLTDSRIGARGASTGATISGQITGAAGIEFNNTGTTNGIIILSNATNNYSGNTTISSGVLRIGVNEVIPNGTGKGNVIINGATDSTVTNNSVLDLNGKTETINGLSAIGNLSKDVVNSSASGTGTLIVGDNNATANFAGAIQNGSSASNVVALTKMGNGIQTLSGTNTYTGATTVNAGTLLIAATGSISNSATITAAGTGILDVSAFNGSGGFTVGSSGPQTLIANGTGSVHGSINLSSILAGSGGTVGTGSDLVTAGGGSSIHPGATASDGSVGTVNIANLMVSGGDYRVDATGAGDKINVIGTATFNGGTITVAPGSQTGVYTILTAQNLIENTAPTLTATSLGRSAFALDFSTPNTIKLDVTGVAANITWNSAGGSPADGATWDIQTNQNWHNGAASDFYFEGDNVTFNDTNNGHYNVNVNGTVNPGSVTVNNSAGNYTIGGGTIAGAATLLKNGTSALTLTGGNSYSGGTTLQNGTINANSSGALGTGAVTVNAGTLNLNSSSAMGDGALTVNAGNLNLNASTPMGVGTLTIGAGVALANTGNNGPVTLSNNNAQIWNGSFSFTGTSDGTHDLNLGTGGITLNAASPTITVAAGTLTVGGSISGGTSSLTKSGVGTLVLGGANSYTGGTNILNGLLQINNIGALGSAGAVSISSGATLDISSASGTLNLGSRTVSIAGAGIATAQFPSGEGAIYNGGPAQESALQNVVLTSDATIGDNGTGTTGRIDIGRNGGPNSLNLNGHTLTKIGTGQLSITGSGGAAVAVTGPGNIVIPSGTLSIEQATTTPANVTITYLDGSAAGFFATTASLLHQTIIGTGSPTQGTAGVIMGNGSGTSATVASPISLRDNLKIGPISGGTIAGSGANPLVLTGNIIESGGHYGITLTSSTLTLSGVNTYSGATTVNSGTLQLGASGSVPAASNLVLGGGTFATGGFSQTMNQLAITGSSIIDMGTTPNILRFNANSSLPVWNGNTLTINNWVGNPSGANLGAGPDQIFVGTNSYSGLSRAELNSIQFSGQPTGAILLNDGELVPNISGTPLPVPILGDWNGDGHVDASDISTMLSALANIGGYETTHQLSAADVLAIGDFDQDGAVTNADMQGFLNYLLAGNGSTAPVPEPTSFVLLAFGGYVLRWRMKRQVPKSATASA